MAKLAEKRKWAPLVKAFRAALDKVAAAEGLAAGGGSKQGAPQQQATHQQAGGKQAKRSKKGGGSGGAAVSAEAAAEWRAFAVDLEAAEAAAAAAEGSFAFAFVEGALVQAVREGWWLLLDEMNLAPAEVRGCWGGRCWLVGLGEAPPLVHPACPPAP